MNEKHRHEAELGRAGAAGTQQELTPSVQRPRFIPERSSRRASKHPERKTRQARQGLAALACSGPAATAGARSALQPHWGALALRPRGASAAGRQVLKALHRLQRARQGFYSSKGNTSFPAATTALQPGNEAVGCQMRPCLHQTTSGKQVHTGCSSPCTFLRTFKCRRPLKCPLADAGAWEHSLSQAPPRLWHRSRQQLSEPPLADLPAAAARARAGRGCPALCTSLASLLLVFYSHLTQALSVQAAGGYPGLSPGIALSRGLKRAGQRPPSAEAGGARRSPGPQLPAPALHAGGPGAVLEEGRPAVRGL